jgi:ABC-2 type transport system ATP-binding protein
MPIIEVRDLVKKFGSREVLKGIGFQVDQGDVFGYAGPDGSGKTTTIRILATLMPPTRGEVFIDGIDAVEEPEEVRPIIGYMPDSFDIYDKIKVWEYLDFYAACYKIPKSRRAMIVDEVLELTELTDQKNTFAHELSSGMKQRLNLARCLTHNPKALLLDEPMNGLDSHERIKLGELLKELGRIGKAVLVSSRTPGDLSPFVNAAAIIDGGKLVQSGRLRDGADLHEMFGTGTTY